MSRAAHDTQPQTFECVGGPLDGERHPASTHLSSSRVGYGIYCFDDTKFGAVWTWIPLGEA